MHSVSLLHADGTTETLIPESEVASLRSEVDRLTRERDEADVLRAEDRKALADESRMIRTVEELDALPEWSVVRDADGIICERLTYDDLPGGGWIEPGDEYATPYRPAIPAELLWTPKDGE
ncbi:hypothetical protein [Gordonia sp. NB41Y]|uniref:hypothetical protein n=1 Tax=Gordonia sp. NB41Y TaxID=875808 RepID=UPI0002BD598B|nr:hypothetical protein [Gordonia sp. NB41Y]WLP90231.1 hypothetical protein Q9K23_22400 [Gordonia sp. NB41Y]